MRGQELTMKPLIIPTLRGASIPMRGQEEAKTENPTPTPTPTRGIHPHEGSGVAQGRTSSGKRQMASIPMRGQERAAVGETPGTPSTASIPMRGQEILASLRSYQACKVARASIPMRGQEGCELA